MVRGGEAAAEHEERGGRLLVEAEDEAQAAGVGEGGVGDGHAVDLERVVVLLLLGERALDAAGDGGAEVGREAVGVRAVVRPCPAARAEHAVLAPAVEEGERVEGVAAREGGLGVERALLHEEGARQAG